MAGGHAHLSLQMYVQMVFIGRYQMSAVLFRILIGYLRQPGMVRTCLQHA